jgi:hypothetical protein
VSTPVRGCARPSPQFEPFSELRLKTLPFRLRETVTLVRFRASIAFWSGCGVVLSRNLPHPGHVTPSRFGHRLGVFPKSRP